MTYSPRRADERHQDRQSSSCRPSTRAAQAYADAPEGPFNQGLPRAVERDRNAALLRGHARSADRADRYRDAGRIDESTANSGKEVDIGSYSSRGRGFSRRYAGADPFGARRAYRP